MRADRFPVEVAERLKWYVYRLINPRNGETFYIGKWRRDRVFQHAKGAFAASKDEDAADLKFQPIKDIVAAGLEVAHVIHRHNIDDENVAFQIEAALIDAYPGLTNSTLIGAPPRYPTPGTNTGEKMTPTNRIRGQTRNDTEEA